MMIGTNIYKKRKIDGILFSKRFPRISDLRKIFFLCLCVGVMSVLVSLYYLDVSPALVAVRSAERAALGLAGKSSKTDGVTEHNDRPIHETCDNLTRKRTLNSLEKCFAGNQLGYNISSDKCDADKKHFACTHFMTIRDTFGRFGNKMFQIAMLLGTAYYHGYTPVIHPSISLTKWFNLPNLARMKFDNTLLFQERKYCTYDERITVLSHSYNYSFEEYFQSWRYFSGAEEIIRRAFRFKEPILQVAREFLRPFESRHVKTVGVHIRRGDFLSTSAQWYGFNVAPIQYIRRAMEYFTRKYKHMQFIVFSNDKLWCHLNLRWRHVTISPFKLAEQDLAVMTLCDDAIITSGTFGWWGAWLSGGDVIYWKGYPRKGSPFYEHFNHTDYYPSHWIGMD